MTPFASNQFRLHGSWQVLGSTFFHRSEERSDQWPILHRAFPLSVCANHENLSLDRKKIDIGIGRIFDQLMLNPAPEDLDALLPSNWLKARTAAADQIIEIPAA